MKKYIHTPSTISIFITAIIVLASLNAVTEFFANLNFAGTRNIISMFDVTSATAIFTTQFLIIVSISVFASALFQFRYMQLQNKKYVLLLKSFALISGVLLILHYVADVTFAGVLLSQLLLLTETVSLYIVVYLLTFSTIKHGLKFSR